MRMARAAVNSLFSLSAGRLAELPDDSAADVYKAVSGIAALVGRPLEGRLDAKVLKGTMALISEAFERTPYGEPLDLEFPLLISLAAASFCPFACTNCYANSTATRDKGNPGKRLELFRKVAASKTPFVILTGGEPLVADGVEECLQVLLESGKYVFVSTNALVDEYLHLVRANEGRLRFILPIWGDRKAHDMRRGGNSFTRIERNLARLNEAGHKPNLLVVLCDQGFATVFAEIERLVRSNDVSVVTITRRIETGRMESGHQVFDDGDLRAIRLWQEKLREHVRAVVCDLPELQSSGSFGLLHRLIGLPANQGCSAGQWMMHLDDAGQGFPCFSFEGRSKHAIPADLSIEQQWRAVRSQRAGMATGALCIAENRGVLS